MVLIRQYFDVKDVKFGDKCCFSDGILTISEDELNEVAKDLFNAVKGFRLEITHPGENARIIHVLDTLASMVKLEGEGQQYSGFFGTPFTVGRGITNIFSGFSVMESAALPWDETNASSGLLYPRDAIIEIAGDYAQYTPFSEMHNLVIVYDLNEGKSAMEYDNDIRLIAIKISTYLAELTRTLKPDRTETFQTLQNNSSLPNVVLVWQCQNQGPYANTFLYGLPIYDIVPTILHPNEMLDGCIVSGNYVWPAFKVPTYLHVNHPILLDLYRRHGKDLWFKGVILCRSHNPSNWHKQRCASHCVKLAQMLKADGLVMASEMPALTVCILFKQQKTMELWLQRLHLNLEGKTALKAFCLLITFRKQMQFVQEVLLKNLYISNRLSVLLEEIHFGLIKNPEVFSLLQIMNWFWIIQHIFI